MVVLVCSQSSQSANPSPALLQGHDDACPDVSDVLRFSPQRSQRHSMGFFPPGHHPPSPTRQYNQTQGGAVHTGLLTVTSVS